MNTRGELQTVFKRMDVALTQLDDSDLLDTPILAQIVPLIESAVNITHAHSTQLDPGQAVPMVLRLSWRDIKYKTAPLQGMDSRTSLTHSFKHALKQLDRDLNQLDDSDTLNNTILAEIILLITRAADTAQTAAAQTTPGNYLPLLSTQAGPSHQGHSSDAPSNTLKRTDSGQRNTAEPSMRRSSTRHSRAPYWQQNPLSTILRELT